MKPSAIPSLLLFPPGRPPMPQARNDTLTEAKTAESGAAQRSHSVCPVILENPADADYALLDSGNGQKLERYGALTIVRPEAQAIWKPERPAHEWHQADARFTGDLAEEGKGRWEFKNRALSETWLLQWSGISYLGRFTSFRHVGVFPEQAEHWRFIEQRIASHRGVTDQPFRLLNLFGYTGVASLVAARAGAHVTHIDASKKAIGWARENQQLAGMDDLPIRWICEDALKFCEREVRRGNSYDGILLDPPKYGRGPKGEVWQLFEDLPHQLELVQQLVSEKPSFVVLTAYSIRASFYALHEIMQEKLGPHGGTIESGELVLQTEMSDRRLPTSLFSRWVAA